MTGFSEALTKDFHAVLVDIGWRMQLLGWIEVERDPETGRRSTWVKDQRLIEWAMACLERSGYNRSDLLEILLEAPLDRQWRELRIRLPDAALRALDGKISECLIQAADEQKAGGR